MWDPPGQGLEPMSPALAGGFSTTAPPGKSPDFKKFCPTDGSENGEVTFSHLLENGYLFMWLLTIMKEVVQIFCPFFYWDVYPFLMNS